MGNLLIYLAFIHQQMWEVLPLGQNAEPRAEDIMSSKTDTALAPRSLFSN